ncbi:hypothetical protein H310_11526 [Aphanomyces invadans]|uniref:Uncharacterized protein n=1 Tax=Aphanomyces invadans TaxID=157072 RepID=A0A024TMM9_9STRA|nr:hypothetical protein H310_11526 [Aphanomyces invadans]ETV94866.1 hypothetical protein H310_11526 [Aphanomyces invadans]|eukprot:XP_008876457.1 hypothetical protein H310_11526 [Aphanomyces invadans]
MVRSTVLGGNVRSGCGWIAAFRSAPRYTAVESHDNVATSHRRRLAVWYMLKSDRGVTARMMDQRLGRFISCEHGNNEARVDASVVRQYVDTVDDCAKNDGIKLIQNL